jgi:tRNA threonylcarbamoyl adenosine modification protein YeaZ
MSPGEPWLLALDTATSQVVVAAGSPEGSVLAIRTFPAGHRHGSHLLPAIEALCGEAGLELPALAGVIVGLGPGAFTGLRVGLATAKALAHEATVPIAGISTAEALARVHAPAGGGGTTPTVLLPAGARDVVVVRRDEPPRLEAWDPESEPALAIAVDLEGRASAAALERGRRALEGLPATLLELGAERLRVGGGDDVEQLVPVYVSLPRGIATDLGDGGVAWSRDPR